MIVKHIITILFLLFPIISFGQPFTLKKKAKLDTIYLSLQFTDSSDSDVKSQLTSQFEALITAFNNNENSFFIKEGTSDTNTSIAFVMGSIKYVNWKRNLSVTGLDLLLIGTNILLLPVYIPLIPFYLMLSTYSRIDVKAKPELFDKQTKIFVNPNGYLMKKEKQKLRFKKKFDTVIIKFLNKLSKQNYKNKKRS